MSSIALLSRAAEAKTGPSTPNELLAKSESQPQSQPASATRPSPGPKDPKAVQLHVLVIEASKSLRTFDDRIRGTVRKHLEDVGHTGARVLDELSTAADEIGSRIQLEILARDGDAKHLKVTVMSTSKEEVRLRVEIPEFKLDTTTRQKPGSTVALAFRTTDKQILYLSVTPTL